MNAKPADKIPSHALWVELSTRITTQELHYRAGDEETAAHSVESLFKKSRALLEAHPEAETFRAEVLEMLNVEIRPYTARWRGWMAETARIDPSTGEFKMIFRDELVRREFRKELRELRPTLIKYQKKFAELAGVGDQLKAPPKRTATIGQRPLVAGIGQQIAFASAPGGMDSAKTREEINKKEHHEILARRGFLKGEAPAPTLTDATGIALSGGGIRSATYCLGIVQVLVRQKLFAQFDYLSTVSGGGYLGTFISCALGTQPTDEAAAKAKVARTSSKALVPPPPATAAASIMARINDAFHWKENGTESGLMRHLRNNSKYLVSGGIAAKLKIVGLLLSGIIWNFLMVIPLPAFAAVAACYLADPDGWGFWGSALNPKVEQAAGWTAAPQSFASDLVGLMFFTTAAVLVFLPVVYLIAHGKTPTDSRVKFRRLYVTAALAIAVGTAASVVLYFQPALFRFYEWLRHTAALNRPELFGKIAGWIPTATAGAVSVFLGVIATVLKENWPRLKTVAARLFIISGPVFFLLLYLMIGNQLGLGRHGTGAAQRWDIVSTFFAAVGMLLWSTFLLNINTFGPHVFYRGKLCECYLARRRATPLPKGRPTRVDRAKTMVNKWLTGEFGQNKTEALQQVPLVDLGAHPAAPYHLLNMIVNLPGSDSKELRGRDGDFFIASKHFCGAPIVGYQPTEKVADMDPHFDLGTAMAVSGAAASTNMGWKSLPSFRFLLSMLNVRLGYWLRWESGVGAPGVGYFLREMTGSMNEYGSFLNLSDGGHIENLGAYELLRRRCKFIVCVDGGQEPGMECADLTRLQRYAEIDFGIEFEYGVADLSVQPNGFSRASAILVKIVYPGASLDAPNELGWMIYIKLALTGIEPMYVLDYRRENPLFPHQSTGDQIYDEAQFEAYRRLGECAGENLFREELFAVAPKNVREWFQGLADNLLSDNDPVFSTPNEAITAAGASSP